MLEVRLSKRKTGRFVALFGQEFRRDRAMAGQK
jgi:hypothetical protein